MVFIAGSRIIVTNTSMYYYLWDKLSEYAKLETKQERTYALTSMFKVTIANYEEQEITFNEDGTVLYVNGETACISVIPKEAIQKDDELKPIYEHCQELTKQKHAKWLEETFDKEVTEKGVPLYSVKKEESNLLDVYLDLVNNKKPIYSDEPINYHQLAMVAMFGIIFNIDKQGSIHAGKCVDIALEYKYDLDRFKGFIDFLNPFVCEDNPITNDSFDILTYNYCNLYDKLDEQVHKDVEELVLSLIKSIT